MRLVTLGGFLGAGKTTTMLAAASRLRARGQRVAVITNDQGGELVDTRLAKADELPYREVTGGCFCCRFDDLTKSVHELARRTGADTVIAEAVGSCTDLQATVIRPLRRLHGEEWEIAPLTTVVEPARMAELEADPELAYLFWHQLAEADIIGLNKTDSLRPDVAHRLARELRERCPYALVLPYSAATGVGLGEVLKAWQSTARAARDVAIDYERYAAAEARLAWLNTAVYIESADGFESERWAHSVLTELSQSGRLVGHAKVTVQTDAGLTKASLIAAGEQPIVDRAAAGRTSRAAATLNVRMACPPTELDGYVGAAVARADRETGATSCAVGAPAFAPAYPRPTHRISALERFP